VGWTYTDGPWVWIPDAYVLPLFFVLHLIAGIKVYGRRLTALVLGAANSRRETIFRDTYESRDNGGGVESTPKVIPLGDNQQARLVSVQCHKA
jgi:hypothetical protein